MSLVSEVRRSAAAVSERASLVWIREEQLPEYSQVARERKLQPSLDPTQAEVGTGEARIGFVLLRDATNFGSGYHPSLAKIPGLSGARTLGACLATFVRGEGVPGSEWLRSATAADCGAIFRQESTGPAGELMALFAQAWNELGEY